MTRDEYLKRLETLGKFCSVGRAEETVHVIFSCLKRSLAQEDGARVAGLLSGPARELWDESVALEMDINGSDCIDVAQKAGRYPYRAAAEKAFEVIFASIREALDEGHRAEIERLLPPALRPAFEKSRSCALDGSAEEFL